MVAACPPQGASFSTDPPRQESQAHPDATLPGGNSSDSFHGHDDHSTGDGLRIRPGEGQEQQNSLPPSSLLRGDVFLVLGLPGQFQLGCDTMAMTIPKSQKPSGLIGLRDLPPGAHFVWVSSPGSISRQGYWFLSEAAVRAVRVKQWDRYNEVLTDCALQDDPCFLATEVETLYPNLPPYSVDVSGRDRPLPGPSMAPESTRSQVPGIWPRLTSCITEQLLSRVAGGPATNHPIDRLFTTTDTARGELDVLGASKLTGLAEFVFLLSYHDTDPYQFLTAKSRGSSNPGDVRGVGGREFLLQNVEPGMIDATQSITALLENPAAGCTECDIVGELQFAFLTGTLISNLSCLEQWWHVVLRVLLRARGLVACHPRLCRSLIQTLHAQFFYLDRHVVGGFSPSSGATACSGSEDGRASIFDVKPHGAVRLQSSLAVYRRSFQDVLQHLGGSVTREQVAAEQAFALFEAWLWQHGWDLRRDCAPSATDEGGVCSDGGYGDEDAPRYDNSSGDTSGDTIREQGSRRPAQSVSVQMAPDLLYESDDEENLPVLVEFDDNGRQVGLVSWD